jgi:hypothetical protein
MEHCRGARIGLAQRWVAAIRPGGLVASVGSTDDRRRRDSCGWVAGDGGEMVRAAVGLRMEGFRSAVGLHELMSGFAV